MDLELRYQEIKAYIEGLQDFPEGGLMRSRALFHMEAMPPTPRRFEVWTCLVGLPLPTDLTRAFESLVARVIALLPAGTRFYTVRPENYHWELFIIKRPDEDVEPTKIQEASRIFAQVLRGWHPFSLTYRGFLLTEDGTLIARGFGAIDALREELRARIPFASQQQTALGHISLARILDPVGEECFEQLKLMVEKEQNTTYGKLQVNQAKYVHESQWYMEDYETISLLPLGLR